jgi:hypothetical protein
VRVKTNFAEKQWGLWTNQPTDSHFLSVLVWRLVFVTGWYTEKYRRDEEDIDGQIKRMYVSDIKEAHEKLPQMTATIRGQDVRLDDRMNKLVWGGKAHMEDLSSGAAFGGGFGGSGGSKAGKYEDEDDDSTTKPARINISRHPDENDSTGPLKKKKRKKRKGKKATIQEKEMDEQEIKDAERKKLVVQSTVAGITLGAVAVAAVTFFAGGIGTKR